MADFEELERRHSYFDEKIAYERRMVAFYDILGWRDKISKAGADVTRITTFKNVVRMFATMASLANTDSSLVRQSTFSDNVVVSTDLNPAQIVATLYSLAMTQLVCARMGFLIRGGITIGDIVHDQYVALGPALIRAYDLERRIADKPKIILDPDCIAQFGPVEKLDSFLAKEEDVWFLNPWTLQFARAFWHLRPPGITNAPSARDFLATVLGQVLIELQGSVDEKTTRRLIWLRDRLGPELIKD